MKTVFTFGATALSLLLASQLAQANDFGLMGDFKPMETKIELTKDLFPAHYRIKNQILHGREDGTIPFVNGQYLYQGPTLEVFASASGPICNLTTGPYHDFRDHTYLTKATLTYVNKIQQSDTYIRDGEAITVHFVTYVFINPKFQRGRPVSLTGLDADLMLNCANIDDETSIANIEQMTDGIFRVKAD